MPYSSSKHAKEYQRARGLTRTRSKSGVRAVRYSEKWSVRFPDKIREMQRASARKQTYGIDRSTYNRMLVEQGGVCAICERPETVVINGRVIDLAVDHDHITGAIRRLLCSRCNGMLGLAGDNIEVLSAAIAYLVQYSGSR